MSVAAFFQAMKDKCTCCFPNKPTELRDQEEDGGKQPVELHTPPPTRDTSGDNLTHAGAVDGVDVSVAVVPKDEDVDW